MSGRIFIDDWTFLNPWSAESREAAWRTRYNAEVPSPEEYLKGTAP